MFMCTCSGLTESEPMEVLHCARWQWEFRLGWFKFPWWGYQSNSKVSVITWDMHFDHHNNYLRIYTLSYMYSTCSSPSLSEDMTPYQGTILRWMGKLLQVLLYVKKSCVLQALYFLLPIYWNLLQLINPRFKHTIWFWGWRVVPWFGQWWRKWVTNRK